MKIQGQRLLPFPRQAVWDALMDPEVLSRTLPGCEELTQCDENTLEGRLQVAIGPVRGAFRGTLAMADREAPTSYSMCLNGQGPSGFLKGEGRVTLDDETVEGGPGTRLAYDLDAQVGGRIAGVGQRLLDSSAKVIAAQGLDGLERQLAAHYPSTPAANPTEDPARTGAEEDAPAAPSQAAFAVAVAQGVARDLIPPHVRLLLWIALAFAAGLVLGLTIGGSS